MRLEEPLALNVSGNATHVFERPVEVGAGNSDKPGQGLRL
jgi:hypothetical protein